MLQHNTLGSSVEDSKEITIKKLFSLWGQQKGAWKNMHIWFYPS